MSASVLASVLFAGLSYYATLLTPLNGEDIFGWRSGYSSPKVRGAWIICAIGIAYR